jgi:hypothetical protein
MTDDRKTDDQGSSDTTNRAPVTHTRRDDFPEREAELRRLARANEQRDDQPDDE